MTLSKREIDEILRQLELTRDQELNCQQCLDHVAEFAERELAGQSIADSLQAVAHHLDLCPECREEYEALKQAIQGIEG